MGSLRAEFRRFERRRVRPFLQRLRRLPDTSHRLTALERRLAELEKLIPDHVLAVSEGGTVGTRLWLMESADEAPAMVPFRAPLPAATPQARVAR